jgi:hypothetical protein
MPLRHSIKMWVIESFPERLRHTDMRRGMNSLAIQVQQGLKRDPHAGDLYVFRRKVTDARTISAVSATAQQHVLTAGQHESGAGLNTSQGSGRRTRIAGALRIAEAQSGPSHMPAGKRWPRAPGFHRAFRPSTYAAGFPLLVRFPRPAALANLGLHRHRRKKSARNPGILRQRQATRALPD